MTVLPVCSKIFEKCIHSQVSQFLENNDILSQTQFGFRKNRNTELAATLFLDHLRQNMDNGQMTGAIFVDLSKAFDTLSHAQIIKNLSCYGIHDREKELFANYLFNRKQAVRFGQEMSEFSDVTCGVPQGSILGPLLFLLTFNEVESVLCHSKIVTYADDTVIYVPGKSKEDIEKLLNEDFCALVDWLESMHLACNLKKGKTEAMLFGTSKRVKNQSLNIQHRFNTLSCTPTYKYLGIKLDQTLALRDHIDSAYKKASGRLYLLRRIRPQLTIAAALNLYQSMILPIFMYCSILTSSYSRSFEEKIHNFERRSYHTIYKRLNTHDTGKVSIRALQKRRLCTQVFNCINGNMCSKFANYFEVMSNNTRNSNKLIRLPYVKLESSKKSFRFVGAREYNKLPIEIRDANTTNEFISLYNKVFKI